MPFLINSHIHVIPFSPDDVSGLGAWYDANDSSTITKDVNDRVSQWDDKKGTDNLTQTTGGNQPLLLAANQNGKDVIDFVGSRFMTNSITSVAQPQTWYLSMIPPSSSGTTRRPLVSDAQQFHTSGASNSWKIDAGTELSFTENLGSSFVIIKLVFNGSSSSIHVNDVSKASGNAGTGTAGSLNVAGKFSNFADNKFGEILRYDSTISSADNTSIMNYLNNKWGT